MTAAKLLKRIRIAVEATLVVAMVVLFLCPVAATVTWLGWLARIQWLPSAMAFILPICIGWLVVTMCFGRIYCSTVCPLGAAQDLVGRLRRHRQYHYSKPNNTWKYLILLVVLTCLAEGAALIPSLFDPYSAFGRILTNIIRPALWGCVVSILTVFVVGLMAWKNGRTWCNTVCPVGTTLGIVARYSVFHIDINTDKCIQCRHCEHVCKSRCIDLESHTVDMSRCVVCFDCLPVCPNNAIHYTPSSHRLSLPMMQRIQRRKTAPTLNSQAGGAKLLDRRRFLAKGIVVAMAPLALKADNMLPAPQSVNLPLLPPIAPPGAADRTRFLTRCTNCGLCVAKCPTGVIRPAAREYGLRYVMHPMLDFNAARCDYDCTICTRACPAGALTPLTLDEKHSYRLGTAHVVDPNCVGCGKCERACPVGAVTVTDHLARVDTDRCIGCGACQNVCPAHPVKAIYVAPST